MLEVKYKTVNAAMFGLAHPQDIALALATAVGLEAGQTGAVGTHLLGAGFTGDMGASINADKVCIGIVIEHPALPVDEATVKTLAENGIPLAGAYNMAACNAYHDLAEAVGKSLIKGEVEPTLKLHFGEAGEDGCALEQRPVKKVEIIMNGMPTGHPLWTMDAF